MRTHLMAAAAAAALLTAGVAVAQNQNDQNMQGGNAPATTHMKGSRAGTQPQTGTESGSMRSEQPGANLHTQPTGNEMGPNPGMNEQNPGKSPNATSNERMRGNENMRTNENAGINERTNERTNIRTNVRNRTNIKLTTVQRTKIRNNVILSGRAPRVRNVNFRINVGVRIPRSVNVAVVPPTIVDIFPQWAGYDYFVYGEQIVIIDPATFAIMAVLPV